MSYTAEEVLNLQSGAYQKGYNEGYQLCKREAQQCAVWVKASDFEYEIGVAYHAKDSKSKGGGVFNGDGAFIWGDRTLVWPKHRDDLYILDESGVGDSLLDMLQSINLSDIDAPVFTHTRQFREHFDYIKKKFIEITGKGDGKEGDKERVEIERRNKLLEENMKLGMRLNMPGISEQEQESTWQDYKRRNNL